MTNKTNKKIRVVFYGDSPTVATGFGTVSRNILLPMHATGLFDIKVLGVNYYGDPHEMPFPIWPASSMAGGRFDPYGVDKTKQMLSNMDFDLLLMLQDSFILEFVGELIPQLKAAGKKFKSIVYFPIDGFPKKKWVEAMSVADYPVTYTKWAVKQCEKVCPPIASKLRYIYHGVNTSDFYPLSYKEIVDFRKQYFGKFFDKFIITNVNRNQRRKDLPKMMIAFKEFKKVRPNSLLYLHCAVQDQGGNLQEIANQLGLVIGEDLVFPVNFGPNQGYPIDVLNMIYNASDVVVSTCLGEGWGLSTVEAMAAKTPIIFPSNTSLPEILGEDRGLLVKSGATWSEHMIIDLDNEVLRPLVNVEDMVEKLCMLYDSELMRHQLAEAAYKWITEELVWEKNITPRWISLCKEVYDSLISGNASENVCVEAI
jgi:glycosyltransferase involved in cell wall biosynthesis